MTPLARHLNMMREKRAVARKMSSPSRAHLSPPRTFVSTPPSRSSSSCSSRSTSPSHQRPPFSARFSASAVCFLWLFLCVLIVVLSFSFAGKAEHSRAVPRRQACEETTYAAVHLNFFHSVDLLFFVVRCGCCSHLGSRADRRCRAQQRAAILQRLREGVLRSRLHPPLALRCARPHALAGCGPHARTHRQVRHLSSHRHHQRWRHSP